MVADKTSPSPKISAAIDAFKAGHIARVPYLIGSNNMEIPGAMAGGAFRAAVRLTPEQDFTRVRELFERTTQFNTTGRTFSSGELRSIAAQGQGGVFAVEVWDRFGAPGLVGAAVVSENEILALALSCRVLGMGVEARFLGDLLAHFAGHLAGRIIETARNIPVRRLYQDHGFLLGEDGVWRHAPVDNRS